MRWQEMHGNMKPGINGTDKTQYIEYDFLAPDTVNEIFDAIDLLKKYTGKAFAKKQNKKIEEKGLISAGANLLETKDPVVDGLEILANEFENAGEKCSW